MTVRVGAGLEKVIFSTLISITSRNMLVMSHIVQVNTEKIYPGYSRYS